jgi:hypothetical protein
MAKQIEMSATGIIKVVTGQQQPGRQLLTAIVKHSPVNAAWLLTGQGFPYTTAALPMVQQALPEPPGQCDDSLSDERLSKVEGLYKPSRYWLKIQKGDAILRSSVQKIREKDLLLMETNASEFPQGLALDGKICVVRMPGVDSPRFKLADVEVTYEEGIDDDDDEECLLADTFDLGPAVIMETVIHEYPGEDLRVFKRPIRRKEGKTPSKHSPSVPLHPEEMVYEGVKINYSDIVAVCILIVR